MERDGSGWASGEGWETGTCRAKPGSKAAQPGEARQQTRTAGRSPAAKPHSRAKPGGKAAQPGEARRQSRDERKPDG
ncbi:hypothetical protein JCM33774_56840 [Actinophytocola sp. KF-1]